MAQSQVLIHLIRHAQSLSNVDQRNLIGGHDLQTELTPQGEFQARALGHALSDHGVIVDQVFTSSAVRTQMTAEIALDILHYSQKPIVLPELLEQDQGDWEGRSREIYNQADIIAALLDNSWDFVQGDVIKGESKRMVAERMKAAIAHIVNAYQDRPGQWHILIFTHGLAIKFLLAEILNLDKSNAWKIPIDNTSVTQLTYVDGILSLPLAKINNTDHLSSRYYRELATVE